MDAVRTKMCSVFLGVGCQKWHSWRFISAKYKNVLIKLMLLFFFSCLELAVVQLSVWCSPPFLKIWGPGHQCWHVGWALVHLLEKTAPELLPLLSLSCWRGLGLGLWASPAQCGCCFGVFWMWMWSSLSVLCFARILFWKNRAVAMK